MIYRGTVRNMLSFMLKNKFEKSLHLVVFTIRIYHDARSAECQICGKLVEHVSRYLYSGQVTHWRIHAVDVADVISEERV